MTTSERIPFAVCFLINTARQEMLNCPHVDTRTIIGVDHIGFHYTINLVVTKQPVKPKETNWVTATRNGRQTYTVIACVCVQ